MYCCCTGLSQGADVYRVEGVRNDAPEVLDIACRPHEWEKQGCHLGLHLAHAKVRSSELLQP